MAEPKIERQYMAHFIDYANLGSIEDVDSKWYWLGDDLDDYSLELNPDVQIETNILGNEFIIHDTYEIESEADVNYARKGDKLFPKLQAVVDNLYRGTRLKTYTLDVHMWENPTWGTISFLAQDNTYNPKKLGWYVESGGKYVLSNDTVAMSGETYYYKQYPAVRRRCYIVPTSFGGDTSGYQIPFMIKYYHHSDEPNVTGLFDISLWEFTE